MQWKDGKKTNLEIIVELEFKWEAEIGGSLEMDENSQPTLQSLQVSLR